MSYKEAICELRTKRGEYASIIDEERKEIIIKEIIALERCIVAILKERGYRIDRSQIGNYDC